MIETGVFDLCGSRQMYRRTLGSLPVHPAGSLPAGIKQPRKRADGRKR